MAASGIGEEIANHGTNDPRNFFRSPERKKSEKKG